MEKESDRLGRLGKDPVLEFLFKIITFTVKCLAALMTLVIVWGLIDVIAIIYESVSSPPYFLLHGEEIVNTFGSFMSVLIAIEIFINIALYLRHEVIHVRLVLGTALIAIARKAIVMDFKELSPQYIFGIAAVILATGLAYWLAPKERQSERLKDEGGGKG